MKRTAELKRAPFRAKPSTLGTVRSTSKPARKSLKSKQLAVTAEEKAMWDRLATEIGCIACTLDGHRNTHVSIHHVDGRTKPGCHKLVLPLCAPHHQQDDTDPARRVAIHPNKARFEKLYGTQEKLMAICAELLGELK